MGEHSQVKPADLDCAIAENRERCLLRAKIKRLIAEWEPKLGVHVRAFDVKEMKLYWASTNEADRKITFNQKLAELPAAFLKITVVHELAHLLTDGHDDHFFALMDRHVPGWRKLHAQYDEPLTQHS